MLSDHLRSEMIFYATTGDYSDAERYERFALGCELDVKASEIGAVVRNLALNEHGYGDVVEVLETASATGLTAAGVISECAKAGIVCVYTSLDREKNLLEFARERRRGDMFVQADFEDLPFASMTFHIYIMMGAEGYRPKGTFYLEVRRVLRVGGFFVMPQIGPRPVVGDSEKEDVLKSGLELVRADNYLIAKKVN